MISNAFFIFRSNLELALSLIRSMQIKTRLISVCIFEYLTFYFLYVLQSLFKSVAKSRKWTTTNKNKSINYEKFDIIPVGIARPRNVHRTSLLGPSVHVPYCTSIGYSFSVHCSRVDRTLIWTSNGLQMLHTVEHQISHMWLYCWNNNY